MSGQPADFCRPGPGAGFARDYAVFFTKEPRDDPAAMERKLDAHLGQYNGLRRWAAAQGVTLGEDARGVEALEGLLAGSDGTRPPHWRLRVETGLFLGTVLVRNNTAARWFLVPDGYPVVHLAKNSDLDVIALARSRLETGAPDLRTVLPYAESLTADP